MPHPNHTTTLTALLALTATFARRMDGDGPKKDPETKPADGERSLTREQWEAVRQTELAKENQASLTTRVIKLEGEAFELRRKQAPDGGLILTGDQRKAWEAYQQLGKPDELKPLLEQGKKDRERVQQVEKTEQLTRVAQAAGWDLGAFRDLDTLAGGLEWTVQTIKDKDGNDVQQVTVKDGQTTRDAVAFAEERWAKFLPVLQASETRPDPSPASEGAARTPLGAAGGGKGKAYTVADAEQVKADSGQYQM
jgi:hypothetical protein